jgi:hypothetical protein
MRWIIQLTVAALFLWLGIATYLDLTAAKPVVDPAKYRELDCQILGACDI